jgi:hypothetical protein
VQTRRERKSSGSRGDAAPCGEFFPLSFTCAYANILGISVDVDVDSSRKLRERRCAWCQLLIGQAQVAGATIGVILLVAEGVTVRALGIVGVTLMVSLFSRFYFRVGLVSKR